MKIVRETKYINKYGNTFLSKESARQDEINRDFCRYKVETIIPNLYFEQFHGEGIEGINDYGKPMTGQINDKTKVFLFKNIISELQKLIDKYGENVGYTHQHFGMGQMSNAVVILKENDAS